MAPLISIALLATTVFLLGPRMPRADRTVTSTMQGTENANELELVKTTIHVDSLELAVVNQGGSSVTIAQVQVAGAYWSFSAAPSATVAPAGMTTLRIDYSLDESAKFIPARLVSTRGGVGDLQIDLQTARGREGAVPPAVLSAIAIAAILPLAASLIWIWTPLPIRAGLRDALCAGVAALVAWQAVDAVLRAVEAAAYVEGVWHRSATIALGTLAAYVAIAIARELAAAFVGGSQPSGRALYAIGIAACALHAGALGMTLADAAAKGEGVAVTASLRQLAIRETTRGAGVALAAAAISPSTVALSCAVVGAAVYAGPLLARAVPTDALAIALTSFAVGADAQFLVALWRRRTPAKADTIRAPLSVNS